MGAIKSPSTKRRLGRALRRAKPVPVWIIARTMRHVRVSARRRHWRLSKLKA
jgi:ribosomal protein L39E